MSKNVLIQSFSGDTEIERRGIGEWMNSLPPKEG